MGTAGEEQHSRQKQRSEPRSGVGVGGGMDSWSCGVWHVVRPVAPEHRVWDQGRRKEEADCGLCQPWTSALQRAYCPE